jgi:hypothetical protein
LGASFQVDEEVEGLCGRGVEDAVLGTGLCEFGLRVEALEGGEDGVDVEGLEGPGGG